MGIYLFKRMTTGEKIFQVLLIVFMVFLCCIMVYPFLHSLAISFSTAKEALRPGLHIIPHEVSLEAYKSALGNPDIWRSFGYTVFKTVLFTVTSMTVMTCAAYALSRKQLPMRGALLLIISFTMYFGGGLIPTYLQVKNLGMLDSTAALIIPGLVNTFSLIVLKNSFTQLPVELEESAKIDGANDIKIMFRIMLPISMPILATISLWTIVGNWNEWFNPMIYVQDPSKMVLQILLRRLIVENNDSMINSMMHEVTQVITPDSMKAAVLVITIAPILLVYPFLQKYFVSGIMVGSVKG